MSNHYMSSHMMGVLIGGGNYFSVMAVTVIGVTIGSKKLQRSLTYFTYSGSFILPSISSILLGSSKYHCEIC